MNISTMGIVEIKWEKGASLHLKDYVNIELEKLFLYSKGGDETKYKMCEYINGLLMGLMIQRRLYKSSMLDEVEEGWIFR